MPKAPKISVDRVKQVLDYDPNTGVFKWKAKTAKGTIIGAEAGIKPSKQGYKVISLDRGDYFAQRLAWAIMTGSFSEHPVTFKDENRLNLKWNNLIEKKVLHKAKFDHSTKEGKSAYAKEWRVLHGDKYKDSPLKSDFGISLEQYNQMLLSQKGCCDICGNPETATRSGRIKALAVDHCHESGFIRALLCNACNVGLGAFGDDVDRMKAAIAYLEKHRDAQKNSNIISIKTGENK